MKRKSIAFTVVCCLAMGFHYPVTKVTPVRKTIVSIKGEDFYINNEVTLKNIRFNNMQLEGLLPNSRMVQGVFDDYNPATRNLWVYPDTKTWDADRNTTEFIAAMPLWKEHGLLAFTLNLQGGSPYGYSADKQQWANSAFKTNGALDKFYMQRLEKILNKADELGMVVILGYFYFGQDQNLSNEAAVINATKNATRWILNKDYLNVLVEINNECDINDLANKFKIDPYDHPILGSKRVHELIKIVKTININNRSLLVSTSFKGGAIPSESVLQSADFVLFHGNGVEKPEGITQLIKTIRANKAYKGNPIVCNEDDHFNFENDSNHFLAATREHASWGYFDYRMKAEGFECGYQSVPVNWGIQSTRKKQFFDLLKKMTAGN